MSRSMIKIVGVGAATGVAGMLLIAGIALYLIPDLKGFGQVALFAGILLLIIYGILGIIGIVKRLGGF